MTEGEVLRGELRDELVAALHRLPELAGRDLMLTAAVGRDHEPQLPGGRGRYGPSAGSSGWPATTRTSSGSPERSSTPRPSPQPGSASGPEVTAFIRPEGYLVTRFIVGSPVSDEAVHRPETLRRVADSLRRIHDGPAIPGLFVPLRIVEAYRALAMARGVPIPPEYDLAARRGTADRGRPAGRPDRAAAVPQRPAQRQLHRRRRPDPDHRLGVRRDGRPVLRSRQLQHQPRADRRRGRGSSSRHTTGASSRPGSPA